MGRFVLLAALITALPLALLQGGWLVIPDRWDPRTPLDVAAMPNLLTRFKLAKLSGDAQLCQQVLATTPFDFARMPDRSTGTACGFSNAVRIDRTTAAIGTPFSLTCRSAVSLALWEQHVLQPTAQRYFGQPVARIEHFGSYACRNIYGRPNATRSQHATAEAFDVAGFVLGDGRRLRVIKDWSGDGAAAGFLREVRTGACEFFDGVLSPDYNAAHRDHFHLDRGRYRMCR